ncbi:DUF3267 domain-containing protein [Natronobeatus ordinarius]|uniref:DUF3267 domain-containing protein n=1 Tax=Natronobeatus ordinarius TaxID=2963433 RepID=UPI0020CF840E|nr:DUF3267 domain-containing protein [Natronobeatus ordinarius]
MTTTLENHDATTAPEFPPAPDGYAEPYAFEYPTPVLLLGSVLLGIGSTLGFGGLLLLVQRAEVVSALAQVTTDGGTTGYVIDLTALAVPLFVALVVTAVIHELLHGAAFAYYGYDVSYGVVPTMGAFYAAAFSQFHERDELLRVGLAPLVVLTTVCVPLLAAPAPTVAITAAFVLILNTAGSIGDLYAVWYLRRLPRGTITYDVDIRRSYVYEPLEQ